MKDGSGKGWAQIESGPEWFGADGLVPVLTASELKVFLWLLTRTRGRREPWAVYAKDAAKACGIGLNSAKLAFGALSRCGAFKVEQRRSPTGQITLYWTALKAWDAEPLRTFITERRAGCDRTVEARRQSANQRRAKDGRLDSQSWTSGQGQAKTSGQVSLDQWTGRNYGVQEDVVGEPERQQQQPSVEIAALDGRPAPPGEDGPTWKAELHKAHRRRVTKEQQRRLDMERTRAAEVVR